MSLCKWESRLNRPATEIPGRAAWRIGCRAEAVLSLGYDGDWRLCASCAELPRFRRYRVATVISTGTRLRRDRAGWWIDGELVRPAPLAEVLARVALPPCPDHERYPIQLASALSNLIYYRCPEPGCAVSGPSAEDEDTAANGWRWSVGGGPLC